MKRSFVFGLAAATTLSLGFVGTTAMAGTAAPNAEKVAPIPEGVTVVTTDQLKGLIGKTGVYVFDSRSKEAYEKSHVDSAASLPIDSFDVSKLPADKASQLVFYCGGPACTLAPTCAGKAKAAGYKNVMVYHEGIEGWRNAKKS